MILGHGDDAGEWGGIAVDFASNVRRCEHGALLSFLREQLPEIGRYPEADSHTAERAIAEYHGVKASEVLLTAGATAGIYLIAQWLRGRRCHIGEPTFSEYGDACRLHGVELTSEGAAQVEWLCVPNNPTGMVADERSHVLDRSKLWVIDHSYEAFTSKVLLSAREAVAAGNVLLIYSLTKRFGLPGLRMGYVVGSERLIAELRSRQMPWSVGVMGQLAVPWLLANDEFYTIDTLAIDSERRRVVKALEAMGVEVSASDSHMLLCRWGWGSAAALKARLAREYGLLVRDASNFRGLSERHFRVALQGSEADDRLIRALTEIRDKSRSSLLPLIDTHT